MSNEAPLPEDYSLWRYGIISPLLHRGDNDPPLNVIIRDISLKSFISPRGERRTISPGAIRDWYYRYLSEGIEALANKPRRDSGDTSLSPQLQTALKNLRKTHPQLTTKKILEWPQAKQKRHVSLYVKKQVEP